ncbi:MAG: amidohydrolase family protein [Betaproteobacteria bacterium]|nr:amidohydrolase family protein [Betaproteobacteria bacterium]
MEKVPAIDNHTHLLRTAPPYNPRLENTIPVMLRSGRPETVAAMKERFNIDWDPANGEALDRQAREAKAKLIAKLGGEEAYWADHLVASNTEIALVNDEFPKGTNARSLRWVPYGTTLLVPFGSPSLAARSPSVASYVERSLRLNGEARKAEGDDALPPTLDAYLQFIDRRLAQFKAQGAVALKFSDAYYRTLRIADTPRARAASIYAEGTKIPPERDDYIALQDYLMRHIFRRCGELKLPVHIHSAHGAGSFLRLQDSDVRHLEDVLADRAYFGTQFVLIHGGSPWHEAAAYLSISKPNVWIDLSAMPFLYPHLELSAAIRKFLAFSPERTLFGTDPMATAMMPVGAEIAHLGLSRNLRRALYRALADLVADGVFTETEAIKVGRGVLRDNARRLYGWE